MENRLTQQLVPAHTGVEECLPSLEMELGGAGNPILGGPRVTAGLKRLFCYEEDNNKKIDNSICKCHQFHIIVLKLNYSGSKLIDFSFFLLLF